MSLDPLGYYADFGVSNTASPDEIRALYRALAKIYHPDVNRDQAATEKFRRITQAYETIGDATKRLAYDKSAKPKMSDESVSTSPPPRQPVEPIKCSKCGKVTAQPRFLVFRQVVSYVLLTQASPKPGIYCSDCAAKQGFRSSAISAAFGWWGFPWGPIYTIREIIRNAFGGERNIDVDEQLRWQNVIAFMDSGDHVLAGSLASQLKSSTNAKIAEGARKLLSILEQSGQKPGRLKSPWKFKVGGVIGQLAMGLAMPAIAYLALADPLGAVSKNGYNSPPARPVRTAVSEPSRVPAAANTPVTLCGAFPDNSQLLEQKIRLIENGHRLTIVNGSSGNAIAKLRNSQTRRLAISFFINKNSTAYIDGVPDGNYIVQFAYGDALSEDCKSFIEQNANEFEGVQMLQTEITSTQIITKELSFTLYAVTGGNARTEGINSTDFDAP